MIGIIHVIILCWIISKLFLVNLAVIDTVSIGIGVIRGLDDQECIDDKNYENNSTILVAYQGVFIELFSYYYNCFNSSVHPSLFAFFI